MSFHFHSAVHFQSTLKYIISFTLSQFAHPTFNRVLRDSIPGLFYQLLSFLFSSYPHVLNQNKSQLECLEWLLIAFEKSFKQPYALESLVELLKNIDDWFLPPDLCLFRISGDRAQILLCLLVCLFSKSPNDSKEVPDLITTALASSQTHSPVFFQIQPLELWFARFFS